MTKKQIEKLEKLTNLKKDRSGGYDMRLMLELYFPQNFLEDNKLDHHPLIKSLMVEKIEKEVDRIFNDIKKIK